MWEESEGIQTADQAEEWLKSRILQVNRVYLNIQTIMLNVKEWGLRLKQLLQQINLQPLHMLEIVVVIF